MESLLGLPELASAHGSDVDRMIVIIHWMMAILFVGWLTFFFYTLFRFRKSRNPTADYVGVRSHTSTYLEVGVAVAEAILLIGFAVPGWAQRMDELPSEKEAVVVRVVAEQFAWNIHYPGKDGVFGRTDAKLITTENPLGLDRSEASGKDDIVNTNQLHVPVDRPVLIRLTSKDVIHSFFLNEMRLKQDAIPGLEIPLWFKPTVTTADMRKKVGDENFTYEIGCAQLCGIGHYRMRGFLTVDTQQEFDAWLAQQGQSAGGEEGWE